MNRKTIVAHVPCNYAGTQFINLIKSLTWVDELVIQDASSDGSVSKIAKSLNSKAICIIDQHPDVRIRLLNSRNVTSNDYILWANSDEIWDGNIKDEIIDFLTNENVYEGGIIEHESFNFGVSFGVGWPQQRLINRKTFYFETDNIHEMPKVPGISKKFSNHYQHYPNQNMLLNWVKNYKYMVTEAYYSPESVRRSSWYNNHSFKLFPIIKYWLRFNLHFLRTVYQNRKFGFAGLCIAHNQIIRIFAQEIVKAEAVRMMDRGEVYETAGHFTMPSPPEANNNK